MSTDERYPPKNIVFRQQDENCIVVTQLGRKILNHLGIPLDWKTLNTVSLGDECDLEEGVAADIGYTDEGDNTVILELANWELAKLMERNNG